jgi:hypothetical protein
MKLTILRENADTKNTILRKFVILKSAILQESV